MGTVFHLESAAIGLSDLRGEHGPLGIRSGHVAGLRQLNGESNILYDI